MKKTRKTKKTRKLINPFPAVLLVISIVQIVAILVLGILLIRDTVALGNYRDLQKKQIAKVTEECNSKISNGMNASEDLTRRVIRTLAKVIDSDPDKLEYIYLRDLSMGYCRASEFVLKGIQDINGRGFIRGDYLFGTGDVPRQITSETFKDIQW